MKKVIPLLSMEESCSIFVGSVLIQKHSTVLHVSDRRLQNASTITAKESKQKHTAVSRTAGRSPSLLVVVLPADLTGNKANQILGSPFPP